MLRGKTVKEKTAAVTVLSFYRVKDPLPSSFDRLSKRS